MFTESKMAELEAFAKKIRIETLEQFVARGFGHLGGSMSIVEIITVLYGVEMRYDSANPKKEDRD